MRIRHKRYSSLVLLFFVFLFSDVSLFASEQTDHTKEIGASTLSREGISLTQEKQTAVIAIANEGVHKTIKSEDSPVSPGRLMIYVIGLFLIFSLLTWLVVHGLKREHIAINFGSVWFRGIVLAGLAVFVLIVVVMALVTLQRNRKQILADVEKNIIQVLAIADSRIELWLSERISFIGKLGHDPKLARITKDLLTIQPSAESLLVSKELRRARSFFKDDRDIFPNIGFFIINPDYISIGSMRNTNVGIRNLIAEQYPERLKKAFQGEVAFVPPISSDVHLTKTPLRDKARKSPTMFFMGPIYDFDGKVIAVFTLRVDPWTDFSRILKPFGLSSTGETYAFDRNGILLSNSHYDQQLRQIGLITGKQKSALNITIRDPGGNMAEGYHPVVPRSEQPFTRMVKSGIQQRQKAEKIGVVNDHSDIETDIDGYRDYRGVPSFGAWVWKHDLDIGLASEIDVEEAMMTHTATRQMLYFVLGITLFLALGAVLLVLILGERTNRALMKAKDTLEEKVNERTAELEKKQEQFAEAEERARLLLNSVGDGIFGVDLHGKVMFTNAAANHLLGYEPDELIRQNVHEKIHHSHADGSLYPAETCPMAKAYTLGITETISDEMLWRKDGTGFAVEYTATPVLKGKEITGAVITFRDITERMRMEENLSAERERLQQILDTSPVGVAFSTKGNIHFANPRFKEMFGAGPGDKSPDLYVNPETRETLVNRLQVDGKVENYELQMYNQEHEVRDILVNYLPIAFDDEDGILGWLLDITDRKRMEEALAAEKAHLQKILDTSPVGVGISSEGIMRFANPRILELLNLKIGEPGPEIYVDPEERAHVLGTVSSQGIMKNYELQMYGKNQKIKDMLVTYMKIEYEGKDAVLGWVMDITELKNTDREMRKHFDELSRFRELAVNREIKMIEIKKEINQLLVQLGQESKYKIVE